jgi:hypothetical protein
VSKVREVSVEANNSKPGRANQGGRSGTKDASVASEVWEAIIARERPRLQQRGFAFLLSLKVVFNF